MIAAILKNEFDDNFQNWITACKKYSVDYVVIDMTLADWLDQIIKHKYDLYLACPSGRESIFKQLYDERIYILSKALNLFVYPSFEEIAIHENKRFLSYWLKANNISHPKTRIFYNKKEAEVFVNSSRLPVVGKFNIGASGKGVTIIKTKKELLDYVSLAFSKGLRQNWGPNLKMGGYTARIIKILKKPLRLVQRIKVYQKTFNEIQKGFVLFQEYISHDYEWRVVKIGDSFFGHQKIKQGDKASGTKGINYTPPPDKLLNYVKNICEDHDFNSMAIDLFEDGKGGYLVNELQCIFGHIQAYICAKNGIPGRFQFKNGQWVFEPGEFNTNLSYDLRLENALSMVKNKKTS